MKIEILTLFPQMFEGFLEAGVLGRAIKNKILDVKVHDLRKWAWNNYGNELKNKQIKELKARITGKMKKIIIKNKRKCNYPNCNENANIIIPFGSMGGSDAYCNKHEKFRGKE